MHVYISDRPGPSPPSESEEDRCICVCLHYLHVLHALEASLIKILIRGELSQDHNQMDLNNNNNKRLKDIC